MPPSTPIIYFPMLIQRNKALWGEDADDFVPERWMESERLKVFTRNPLIYAPFSAGPRIVGFFFPFFSPPPPFSLPFLSMFNLLTRPPWPSFQCIGQNYATNETCYFLVRLLQRFDTFTLAPEVQPLESLPPKEWKREGGSGRRAREKVWPGAALTLYVKVSFFFLRIAGLRGILI
jgi:Cytochrome P450